MYAIVYRRPHAGETSCEVAFLGTQQACDDKIDSLPERKGFATYILRVDFFARSAVPRIGDRVVAQLNRGGDPVAAIAPQKKVGAGR